MENRIAKIKINKTIYKIMDMKKDEMPGYTTYYLSKGAKTKKKLVHNRKTNEFTLWGDRYGYSTMTTPEHIELVN